MQSLCTELFWKFIEKRELYKKTINLNDLGPVDSNRIDPRALRDLQNRSEARPGPPWGPPRTPLRSQGHPRGSKGAPRDLRRPSIRALATAETITCRQKSTLKRTWEHRYGNALDIVPPTWDAN